MQIYILFYPETSNHNAFALYQDPVSAARLSAFSSSLRCALPSANTSRLLLLPLMSQGSGTQKCVMAAPETMKIVKLRSVLARHLEVI
jgi:hypothetical protein